MVDSVATSSDYKQKVLSNKNIMQRVLENYSYKRLFDFRAFSKEMCQEVVPRCIKHLKYECEVDEYKKS